jgi:hypothetical protein
MSDLDLAPPESLAVPLWRSLLLNVLDRVSPERLQPLHLTSRPVDVGIPLGDQLGLPWYRSIFANLAAVLSPELLPPLQLESMPVDVGELLSDELAHGWWDSLSSSIRDRLAPEKLPPLQLTARPVANFGSETTLQILDWSELIAGPKVFLKDVVKQDMPSFGAEQKQTVLTTEPEPVPADLLAARMQLSRDLGRTRFRRRVWIGLAAAEAVFLLVVLFRFQ